MPTFEEYYTAAGDHRGHVVQNNNDAVWQVPQRGMDGGLFK